MQLKAVAACRLCKLRAASSASSEANKAERDLLTLRHASAEKEEVKGIYTHVRMLLKKEGGMCDAKIFHRTTCRCGRRETHMA